MEDNLRPQSSSLIAGALRVGKGRSSGSTLSSHLYDNPMQLTGTPASLTTREPVV